MSDQRPPSASKALLIYNALRGGLVVVFLGVAYLSGLRSYAMFLIAFLLSGVASWFLLRPQRIRAGLAVEQAVGSSRAVTRAASPVKKLRDERREKIAAEDAYADSLQAKQDEGQTK